MSSLYEGLPNVLLESLSLKKFIISSNCPTGPKEILDRGKNGFLFKMGEENDLLRKIIFYFQNKEKCKNLIYNGFNRLWRFDYHSNLEKYVKLIGLVNYSKKIKKACEHNKFNNFTNLENTIRFTCQWFKSHKKYLK